MWSGDTIGQTPRTWSSAFLACSTCGLRLSSQCEFGNGARTTCQASFHLPPAKQLVSFLRLPARRSAPPARPYSSPSTCSFTPRLRELLPNLRSLDLRGINWQGACTNWLPPQVTELRLGRPSGSMLLGLPACVLDSTSLEWLDLEDGGDLAGLSGDALLDAAEAAEEAAEDEGSLLPLQQLRGLDLSRCVHTAPDWVSVWPAASQGECSNTALRPSVCPPILATTCPLQVALLPNLEALSVDNGVTCMVDERTCCSFPLLVHARRCMPVALDCGSA